MLYVTTRGNLNPYTAYRALHMASAPDGGFLLPFHHPVFSPEEIKEMAEKSFNECVADVLNRLFQTDISGWELDFCCGRAPVRLTSLRQKILIAEGWHAPSGTFDQIGRTVAEQLLGEAAPVSEWINIAVRAAVWFGIFADLNRSGIARADLSLVTDDFVQPISAWYARRWGLPVGRIVCCCHENSGLWELLYHGQLRFDITGNSAEVPLSLERLIYESGGPTETLRYLDARKQGKVYCPGEDILITLRRGIFACVISSNRLTVTVPTAYQTHGRLLAPASAFAYAGLLDYRAATGESGHAVILEEDGPASHTDRIAEIMAVPESVVRKML